MTQRLVPGRSRRTVSTIFAEVSRKGLVNCRRQLERRRGPLGACFARESDRSAVLEQLIAAGRERRYARPVLYPSEQSLSFYHRARLISPAQTAGAARLLVRLDES